MKLLMMIKSGRSFIVENSTSEDDAEELIENMKAVSKMVKIACILLKTLMDESVRS